MSTSDLERDGPDGQSTATTSSSASAADGGYDAATLLEAIVEPVLASLGYELVHLEWSGSGRHRRLQVFVDHPEGFGLDDCTRLSPILSTALDAAEADAQTPELGRLLQAAYTLEVSSPGLDRPLSRLSHFRRFIGSRATVRTRAPVEAGSNQKTFHGRITAARPDPQQPENDRMGVVELAADDGPLHHISLAQIRRANLVYEG